MYKERSQPRHSRRPVGPHLPTILAGGRGEGEVRPEDASRNGGFINALAAVHITSAHGAPTSIHTTSAPGSEGHVVGIGADDGRGTDIIGPGRQSFHPSCRSSHWFGQGEAVEEARQNNGVVDLHFEKSFWLPWGS